MDASTYEQMQRATSQLRTLVAQYSTRELMGALAYQHLTRMNEGEAADAFSPSFAQERFLLDCFLATAEPSAPAPLERERLAEIGSLLETVLRAYGQMYFARDDYLAEDTADEVGVAMQAFLHYHTNRSVLATTTQVRARALRHLAPLDEVLREEVGVSGTTAVAASDFIAARTMAQLHAVRRLTVRRLKLAEAVRSRAIVRDLSMEQTRQVFRESSFRRVSAQLKEALDHLFTVSKHELAEELGAEAECFFDLLAIERGTAPETSYLTEVGASQSHPLVLISEDLAAISSVHAVYAGTLAALEARLLASPARKRFLKIRDDVLEEDAAAALESLFGSGGRVFRNLAEEASGQFEHDAVVACGRTCAIVESKAAGAREVLREPKKAYVRVRDDFQSKSGVQGAYDQGMRVWTRWADGEEVALYDERGDVALVVSKAAFDQVLVVCVTRENLGPLGVDVAPLLKKAGGQPYPWVIAIDDLQAIASAWRHLGLGTSELIEFLEDRIALHGYVMCSDELEVVGAFLKHGPFGPARKPKTVMTLAPGYADVFDDIFNAEQRGETVTLSRTPLVETDVRRELARMLAEEASVLPQPGTGRVGPNERCPCESGRKYKKCCM